MITATVRKNQVMRAAGILLLLAIAAGGIFLATWFWGKKEPSSNPAVDNGGLRVFLQECGWEAGEEPLSEEMVTIPKEWNAAYEAYQALQKAQGYDLTRYKGKEVQKVRYQVLNFPGQKENVAATLLLSKGKVIGGDVSSELQGGFQLGLKGEIRGVEKDPFAENGQ